MAADGEKQMAVDNRPSASPHPCGLTGPTTVARSRLTSGPPSILPHLARGAQTRRRNHAATTESAVLLATVCSIAAFGGALTIGSTYQ
jgi:hypothetical protein